MMKKIFALILCVTILCVTASAFALTGVVDGPLRLRKKASSSGTIIGWLKDGDTVTITNSTSYTSWYGVTGTAYQTNKYTGWSKTLSGYAMKSFIN